MSLASQCQDLKSQILRGFDLACRPESASQSHAGAGGANLKSISRRKPENYAAARVVVA